MKISRRTVTAALPGLAVAAAFGLAGLGAPAQAQDSMVLKAADVHPLVYPTVEAVVRMGQKLKEATDGRLSIEMFPSISSAARRR